MHAYAKQQASHSPAGSSFALVSVQEGQTIIRKGPYRSVRHPSYTGAIMIFTGTGLAILSWGVVLVLLLESDSGRENGHHAPGQYSRTRTLFIGR
jgi:hypothetical protein